MMNYIIKRDLTDANQCRIMLFDPPRKTDGDMDEGRGLEFTRRSGTEAIFTAKEGSHMIGLADAFCEPGARIRIQVKPADEITLFRDIFIYTAPEALQTKLTRLGHPITKLFAFRLPKLREWEEAAVQGRAVH